MKRFIVLLSALFLLLSLCACSASSGSNGNTETTAALTVNLANTGLPFYSLSELESYLAEHDLEEDVLSGIQWTADGLLFSVVTSPSIHQYPLNVETFASSLLTLETAAATIALIDPAE